MKNCLCICAEPLIQQNHPFKRTEHRILETSSDCGIKIIEAEGLKDLLATKIRGEINEEKYYREVNQRVREAKKATGEKIEHGIKESWKLVKGCGDAKFQLTKEIDTELHAYHMLMLFTVICVISGYHMNRERMEYRHYDSLVNIVLNQLAGRYPWEI